MRSPNVLHYAVTVLALSAMGCTSATAPPHDSIAVSTGRVAKNAPADKVQAAKQQQQQGDADDSGHLHPAWCVVGRSVVPHQACLQIHWSLKVDMLYDNGHAVRNPVNKQIARNVR